MKVLQCEMCGSRELVKQDGLYVCQACGTKYSVEEAKKMMNEGTVEVAGTVKVDSSDELKNMHILAERAIQSNEYWKAYDYYRQILEKNPYDWRAIFYQQYSSVLSSLKSRGIDDSCEKLIGAYPYVLDALEKDKDVSMLDELDKLLDEINQLSPSVLKVYIRGEESIKILECFGDDLMEKYGQLYSSLVLKSYLNASKALQTQINRFLSITLIENKMKLNDELVSKIKKLMAPDEFKKWLTQNNQVICQRMETVNNKEKTQIEKSEAENNSIYGGVLAACGVVGCILFGSLSSTCHESWAGFIDFLFATSILAVVIGV